MVGHGCSLIGLLAYQVEIVVSSYEVLWDKSTCSDITDLAIFFNEEPLASLHVDHHICHGYPLFAINLCQSGLYWPNQQLVIEFDLISWWCIHKDNHFFWWILISKDECVAGLQEKFFHLVVLVRIITVDFRWGEYWTEGRIYGCADSHNSTLLKFARIESYEHAAFNITKWLRNPKSVSSFCDDLE